MGGEGEGGKFTAGQTAVEIVFLCLSHNFVVQVPSSGKGDVILQK